MSMPIRSVLPILLAFPSSLLAAQGAEQAPSTPDRRVIAALELWKGGDTNAWHRALRRLERMGPQASPAVHALIPGLADPDPKIRTGTARVLRAIGAPANPAVPVLIAALEDPDERVRTGASRALGYVGKDVVPELVVALSDPSPLVRLQASRALEIMGGQASPALGPLRERLGDPDPDARRAVQAAIKAILKSNP